MRQIYLTHTVESRYLINLKSFKRVSVSYARIDFTGTQDARMWARLNNSESSDAHGTPACRRVRVVELEYNMSAVGVE